jgi:hypothetical protein
VLAAYAIQMNVWLNPEKLLQMTQKPKATDTATVPAKIANEPYAVASGVRRRGGGG